MAAFDLDGSYLLNSMVFSMAARSGTIAAIASKKLKGC